MTGMQVAEVVEVIRSVPNQFLATVRPMTSINKNKPVDTGTVLYAEIKPVSPTVVVSTPTYPPPRIPEILISKEAPPTATFDSSPTPSLEDVGYYDDEDDGDIPPPLPPRTEDALVILDPPPKPSDPSPDFSPALPPKPREDVPLPNSLRTPHRPPMQKSKSQEFVAKDSDKVGTKKSPRRQYHVYEEIQPRINYVEIDKLNFSSSSHSSKTESLVKVEIDWKHRVHV